MLGHNDVASLTQAGDEGGEFTVLAAATQEGKRGPERPCAQWEHVCDRAQVQGACQLGTASRCGNASCMLLCVWPVTARVSVPTEKHLIPQGLPSVCSQSPGTVCVQPGHTVSRATSHRPHPCPLLRAQPGTHQGNRRPASAPVTLMSHVTTAPAASERTLPTLFQLKLATSHGPQLLQVRNPRVWPQSSSQGKACSRTHGPQTQTGTNTDGSLVAWCAYDTALPKAPRLE